MKKNVTCLLHRQITSVSSILLTSEPVMHNPQTEGRKKQVARYITNAIKCKCSTQMLALYSTT